MSRATQSVANTSASAPQKLVEEMTREWEIGNRKREVKPTPVPLVESGPMRLLAAPRWPGVGRVDTVADILPIVTIPDMPASRYPQFIKPLVGYTLAALVEKRPQILSRVWSQPLVHLTTVAVATRAGLWAALNRVPDASQTVSPAAVRWSARLGSIVVRSPSADDGTEIWRYTLASCPGIASGLVQMIPALVGGAPLQFLLGAALLLQSGEVYAMPLLEEKLAHYYQTQMSPESWAIFAAGARATWDTMSAAAIGGFRVSVTRAVSTDSAFILGAHLRATIGENRTISAQLAGVLASAPESHVGLPGSTQTAARSRARASTEPDEEPVDDCASVADTEAGDLAEEPPPASGASTPRGVPPPPLNVGEYEALTAAIRAVPAQRGGEASAVRNIIGQESIVWG